jgi:hypothetical protein
MDFVFCLCFHVLYLFAISFFFFFSFGVFFSFVFKDIKRVSLIVQFKLFQLALFRVRCMFAVCLLCVRYDFGDDRNELVIALRL